MEKYLNDTLQTKSKDDLERISNTNLMPPYLKRLQFIEDSTRAHRWFEITNDSAYLKKYISNEKNAIEKKPFQKNKTPLNTQKFELSASLPGKKRTQQDSHPTSEM